MRIGIHNKCRRPEWDAVLGYVARNCMCNSCPAPLLASVLLLLGHCQSSSRPGHMYHILRTSVSATVSGAQGQLGNGESGSGPIVPPLMGGKRAFESVCTGLAHTCALDASGKAWCTGECGKQLQNTQLQHWFKGAASSLADSRRAQLCSAGSGSQGQLGTGSNASSTTMIEVAGGQTFRAITCGAFFTCALDTGGQAWCFGALR